MFLLYLPLITRTPCTLTLISPHSEAGILFNGIFHSGYDIDGNLI